MALREARAVDAQVVLGDRPLDITLARVWWALTLWEKFKLTSSLLREGIWMLDTSKMKDEVERMKVGLSMHVYKTCGCACLSPSDCHGDWLVSIASLSPAIAMEIGLSLLCHHRPRNAAIPHPHSADPRQRHTSGKL